MPRTQRTTADDDTAMLQEMIGAAADNGNAVTLEPRDYNITRPLVIASQRGLIIEGHGPHRTRLVWRNVGPAGERAMAMLSFDDCYGPTLRDLSVHCDPSQAGNVATMAVRFRRTTTEPTTPTSTRACVDNVEIDGPFDSGIFFEAQENQNNEHGLLNRVAIRNCHAIGLGIHGTQSKEHILTQCTITGIPTPIYVRGGGLTMIGGAVSGAANAIDLGDPSDPVTFIGTGFEAIRRLCVTSGGPRREPYNITFQGVRVMCDALADDDELIIMRSCGPLNLIGGQYGNGTQRVPTIRVRQMAGASCVVNLIGPSFDSFGSYEVRDAIVMANSPGRVQGLHTCTFVDNAGTTRHYPPERMVATGRGAYENARDSMG